MENRTSSEEQYGMYLVKNVNKFTLKRIIYPLFLSVEIILSFSRLVESGGSKTLDKKFYKA